nr:hypothetical protein [Clostridia bacterium]
MNIKKFASALLAMLMLVSLCACASDDSGNSDTGNAETTTVEETTAAPEGYDYAGKDYDGYEFRVLNFDTQFDAYIRFDIEEQTGEPMDDTVYKRNRFVEDKLNFEITEIQYPYVSWNTDQQKICQTFINSVMAGDDNYDAAYLPVSFHSDTVTGGYCLNLADIPELNIYGEYWDSVINESLTINDTLYAASGPLHLMPFELTWCLVFNQNMMTNLGIEYPYQLVRDGKWTLDKMAEMVEAGANLNGAQDFLSVQPEDDSVYGIAGHTGSPLAFLHSAGVEFYKRNSDGTIELTGKGTFSSQLRAMTVHANDPTIINNGLIKIDVAESST